MESGVIEAYLYGDRYFVLGHLGLLTELNPDTGEVLATRALAQGLPKDLRGISIISPILVSETHLFTGSESGHILSFDRRTWKCDWSYRVKGGTSTRLTGTYFVPSDNRLYYADETFTIYCLAAEGTVARKKRLPRRRLRSDPRK